ncbi:Uncharacterised protein [Mycobacteroides abscessus subsp. massiliense]|nr:Uncharacterised protein [Mycobacteroides abscessus subsp. massiliense]
MRKRSAHQELGTFRPLPFGQLDLRHGENGLRGTDDTLGLTGGPTRVSETVDVVRGQIDRCQGPGREARGRGNQILAHLGQFYGHRPQREHARQRRHLGHQRRRAFHELRCGINDERGDLGIGQDIGVIIERAERMQRGAASAEQLPGTDH